MMRLGIFQTRNFHFVATLVLTIFLVTFQSWVLARQTSPWLRVDLVSILVVYMAFEHFLLGACVRVLAAALLLESTSAVPGGFYIMYFLVCVVVANVLSRHLVLHNFASQFLAFAALHLGKWFALFFIFAVQGKAAPGLLAFLAPQMPGVLVTILLCVPLFSLLARFDGMFEFTAVRDRKQEIMEKL